MPRTIQDEASGMAVSRLTLAELLKTTPQSSVFQQLVASSRFYRLTSGGINAPEFRLTEIGQAATDGSPSERGAALRDAVSAVQPFRIFLTAFNGKKIPGAAAGREFLVKNASVPPEHTEECLKHLLADADTAGIVRVIGSARYIDLVATPTSAAEDPIATESDGDDPVSVDPETLEEALASTNGGSNGSGEHQIPEAEQPTRPQAIFVAGRKGKSLEQLIAILHEYQIPHKVTELEAHRGRPISTKVADTMSECGAAIVICTPDEELRDLEGNSIWRPTENVIHELGAASLQYGNRIVIFREERVTFASNYSDIGHITFKEGDLSAKAVELFRELIAFGLVKVTIGA